MTDTPIRLAGLRGTLASFAVDLFAGRVGCVTDAPLCSGVLDRWGIYDGNAWRLGPASDYAGNSHMFSLAINNNAFVDSARNVSANTLRTGGLLRVDANGDFTGRNQTLTGRLTLNGATRPAWGGSWVATMLGGTSAINNFNADGGSWTVISNNLYFDGTNYRAIESSGSTRYPCYWAINANGGCSLVSSQTLPTAGGVIADMVPRFQMNRFGGIGVFGVTPPTTRPTISGQRTATATLAALYAALSDTGLILDSTTGSSVQREFPMQNLPITNSAPAVVTIVNANMKGYGFSGTGPAEEMFYDVDLQHDYIAGTDIVFHIHWAPATGTGGNVKWQLYYQWTENGAVVQAPTLASVVTAANATALTNTVSAITISGTDHTYQSILNFRLFRDSTDAADTYAGTAIMLSRGTHYQSDPGQA